MFIAFGGHFTGEDNKLLEEKKKVFEELSKQVDELYKKKVGRVWATSFYQYLDINIFPL